MLQNQTQTNISEVSAVEAFVNGRFPNQFLIHVTDFATVVGESYGSVRNRIAAGTFELPIVRRGSRNFVTASDLVQYLLELQEPGASVSQPVAKTAPEENEQGSTGRRCKYGPEAKARAAASRLKRQAAAAKARAAKQEKQEGGAA